MGMLTKAQELAEQAQESSTQAQYDNIKKFLKEKDGLTHVVMINSFSKFINKLFSCEDKYTTQIDSILTSMQKDGYEILDVKFNVLQDQGVFKSMEGFNTLITYK